MGPTWFSHRKAVYYQLTDTVHIIVYICTGPAIIPGFCPHLGNGVCSGPGDDWNPFKISWLFLHTRLSPNHPFHPHHSAGLAAVVPGV